MTDQASLTSYIEGRIHAGASKQVVLEQLTTVGWSDDEAEAAYARALVATGVPVPDKSTAGQHLQKASTMDVVLNFFSFILLGVVATALGTLYFAIINYYFPDPLMGSGYYAAQAHSSAVHYAIAALIIAFPLYYLVVRFWFKRFRDDVAKAESKLTKWLTYLVLLVASVTVVGDLIVTLFTFFQGEISARFFLKALTILVIAGSVFGFYFLERKRIQYRHEVSRTTFQTFGIALSVVVALGVLLGFMVAGSPATERMRGFDEQRANDLSQLAGCLNDYAHQYQALPATIDELEKTSYSYCVGMHDPETGEPYFYEVLTPVQTMPGGLLQGEYQLCATFSLSTEPQAGESAPYRYDYYASGKWFTHAAGYECDTESVSINKTAPVYP